MDGPKQMLRNNFLGIALAKYTRVSRRLFRKNPRAGGKHLTSHNHFHNLLRLSNVLTSFPFTTSETMHDYYL